MLHPPEVLVRVLEYVLCIPIRFACSRRFQHVHCIRIPSAIVLSKAIGGSGFLLCWCTMVGWRQRAARAESARGPASSSALAEYLLDQWSWGHMSAVQVQRIAGKAKHDGLLHPEVDVLASLGSCGLHTKNCHRDLLKKIGKVNSIVASV